MIDLMSATRGAVFRALSAASIGAPVFDDVLEDTQPPFVKIGTIESNSDASKGEQFETITVEIVSVYRGRDRGKLLAMMHAARTSLDGGSLTVTGALLQQVRFLNASASDVAADGVTYAGLSYFEVLAQPA